MTIPSSVAKSGPYLCNGVTDVFNYDFRIVDKSHLNVILANASGVETTLDLTTHYTVSDVGADVGTINLTSAGVALAVTGTTLTILRNPPFTQETDLQNQGAYLAQTVEDRFDLLTMQVQTVKERSDRSIAIPASDDTTTLDKLAADLVTVAGIAPAVSTVAGIASDVTIAATNMAAIIAAPGAASDAANSATAAAQSEENAAADAEESQAARDAALSAVPNAFPVTRSAMAGLPVTVTNARLTEDGYAGDFSLVDASDYSDLITAGATGEVVASTTDLTKAWVRRRTPDVKTVDFKAFGAAGGATDDTTLWNAMMDRLASSTWDAKKVIIPPSNFTLADAAVKSGVHIELMAGARVSSPDWVSGTAKQVFTGTGSLGTGIALSADVPINQDYVPLAAGGTGFVPTEYVLVQSDNFVSGSAGQNQEVARVLSVTDTKITLTKPLTTGFLTADNAKIYHLTPLLGAKISGQGEIVAGNNQNGGIYLIYPVGCLIEDGVSVRNARAYGAFAFDTGFNSHVRGCSAFDGAVQTAGLGYGIAFGSSTTFCGVESCYFENVRENMFTNRTRWSWFKLNTVKKASDSCFNTHGAGSDHNTCSDNVFSDSSQGVVIGQAGGGRSDEYNLVQNNSIYNCDGSVTVTGKTGGAARGNVVKANLIERSGTWAVQAVYQGQSLSIDLNIIRDMQPAAVNAINIDTCADGSVSRNTVLNHSNVSGNGLRFNASSNLSVHGNTAEGVAGTPYYVRSGNTNIDLTGNTSSRGGSNSIAAGTSTERSNSWNSQSLIQSGTATITLTSATTGTVNITFPTAYAAAPVFTPSAKDIIGTWAATYTNLTATGATIKITDTAGTTRTGSVEVGWIAMPAT